MVIVFIAIVVMVLIDQLTKYFIVQNLYLGESVSVIPGLLNFTYSHNDGMALGIGSESFRWVFIGVTIIVCGILIYFMFRPEFKNKLFFSSVALIVGGGIGNLIDRILNGYVVDFISLSFFPPICNFADYCVTAGTVCLVVYIIFYYGKNKIETSDVK